MADPKPRIDEDGVRWCDSGCGLCKSDEYYEWHCEFDGSDHADPGGGLCLPAVRELAATSARRLRLLVRAWRWVPERLLAEKIRAELDAAGLLDDNGRVKEETHD